MTIKPLGKGLKRHSGQILTIFGLLVLISLAACQSTKPKVTLPELEWIRSRPGYVIMRESDLRALVIENEQNKKRLEILHAEGARIP